MTRGRKFHRHVTQDEWRLWKAVTKEITPLEPDRAPAGAEEEPALAAPPASHKPKSKVTVPDLAQRQPAAKTALRPKPSSPPLNDFETRRARRLGSGRLPIQARLDLHGLRQDEAHMVLLRFLRAAQANGLKHVKVITGKGNANPEAEVRPFSLFDDNRRGVLRDSVPRWLNEHECRPLVVSFTEAGRSHGGSGALYIQIRKKAGT